MPCDSQTLPNQTLRDRIKEVQDAVKELDNKLKARQVKPIVGPQGAIAFAGWEDASRRRITDACAYRRIMATGSALAKAEIARAETMAGRSVDKKVIATGAHSHDGGKSWHGGH